MNTTCYCGIFSKSSFLDLFSQPVKLGVPAFITLAGVVGSGVVGSGIGGEQGVTTVFSPADTMTKLPNSASPCDTSVALRQVAKMYTPSIIYTSKDEKHRTKKNLGRRRFLGMKRNRTEVSHTTMLSPPHSPRSHYSQSSGISSMHRTCPSEDLSTDSESESNMKKPRYELNPYDTPAMSMASSSNTTTSSSESYEEKKQRYLKTAAALRQSGLLDITMKTADLLRKNQELQKSIEALQNETRNFVTSVLSNKENRPLLQSITSRAQLYELVVPGSQSIMSVSAIPSLSAPVTQPSLEAPPVTQPGTLAQQLDNSGDSSSSNPDQSSPTPNTSSSDPNSDTSLQSDDNETT